MPLPTSDPAAAPRLDRPVVALLAAVILGSAILGGLRRGHLTTHTFGGIVAAVAFWFCANRFLAWVVAAKTRVDEAPEEVATADDDPDLAPVLAELEATRLDTTARIERRVRRFIPLGLAAGVLLWAWTQFSRDPGGLVELGFFTLSGAGAGYVWASVALAAGYNDAYKAAVLPRLAAQFGALTFRHAVEPDAAMLKQQRLFPHFEQIWADDEIYGTYRGIALSIVELKLLAPDGNDTKVVFDGLFTRVTLPRTLTGTTAVIADGGMIGGLRDALRGNRVRLEDPVFERVYQVFGTDQIAARALLTPAFMERFLTLGDRTGFQRPVALAEGNDLTIALPKQAHDNLFEPPSYSRPAASRTALAKLHGDIAAVLSVADAVLDLDQSVRGSRPVGSVAGAS